MLFVIILTLTIILLITIDQNQSIFITIKLSPQSDVLKRFSEQQYRNTGQVNVHSVKSLMTVYNITQLAEEQLRHNC